MPMQLRAVRRCDQAAAGCPPPLLTSPPSLPPSCCTHAASTPSWSSRAACLLRCVVEAAADVAAGCSCLATLQPHRPSQKRSLTLCWVLLQDAAEENQFERQFALASEGTYDRDRETLELLEGRRPSYHQASNLARQPTRPSLAQSAPNRPPSSAATPGTQGAGAGDASSVAGGAERLQVPTSADGLQRPYMQRPGMQRQGSGAVSTAGADTLSEGTSAEAEEVVMSVQPEGKLAAALCVLAGWEGGPASWPKLVLARRRSEQATCSHKV